MAVTKWEYLWAIPEGPDVIGYLDGLGKSGWEVVRAPDFHEAEGAYFLKRQLAPPRPKKAKPDAPAAAPAAPTLGLGSFFSR